MTVKKDGTERKKREMTPELLEKLALARQKALEVKRAEKEGGDEAKLLNLQKRMDKLKQKSTKKVRIVEPEKVVEDDTDVEDVDSNDRELTEIESIKSPEPQRISKKKKGKQPLVIVREQESSSDEEPQQVIYIKDRKKKNVPPPPPPVYPPAQPQPSYPPPPLPSGHPPSLADSRYPVRPPTAVPAPRHISASQIMRGSYSTG